MKVALVHDFLTQYGGAERVLEAFLEIFPDAPIYTLVYDPSKTGQYFSKYKIRTSFLQKMPFGIKQYKWYLTLMPEAIESFNLKEFDLVLSDASAYAKGVVTYQWQTHICYCHTPTRYLWSDRESYLKTAPIPKIIRPFMPPFLRALKKWDYKAAQRPNFYIANSCYVAERIKKYYNREADAIIFPPVETKKFKISKQIGDYYLFVGRLEPYKKAELAIETFNKLGLPLIIAGGGSKTAEIQKIASPNIKFVGKISDMELADLYSRALALIFPPEEDAGITPLEAMASGRPVIAYGKGGALESVRAGVTGEFFPEQTVAALAGVIKKFKPEKYNPAKIRAHAEKFDKEIFMKKVKEFIKNKLEARNPRLPAGRRNPKQIQISKF